MWFDFPLYHHLCCALMRMMNEVHPFLLSLPPSSPSWCMLLSYLPLVLVCPPVLLHQQVPPLPDPSNSECVCVCVCVCIWLISSCTGNVLTHISNSTSTEGGEPINVLLGYILTETAGVEYVKEQFCVFLIGVVSRSIDCDPGPH